MQFGQLPQIGLRQVLLLAQRLEPLRKAIQFLGHTQLLRHVEWFECEDVARFARGNPRIHARKWAMDAWCDIARPLDSQARLLDAKIFGEVTK